jgi:hypothetical protein
VEVPSDYLIGATIGMPDSYKAALTYYVVYSAEVIDNEHAETARAKEFFNMFMQALQADMMQRNLVDSEDGAVEEVRSDRRRG